MAEPHDWPFEQPARGTLRPWYLTAAGKLAVLFPDSQEAQRAKQGLLERGVPANDVRLYDAEEVLSIASRLQQERSILPMLANSGKRAPIRSERQGVFC